jgi:glycosyltransferase involved in cell wall biosynthesis
MKKVSVIIPTYNRFDFLLKSIESVKNQTYKNIEIIVIDDCSKDYRYSDLEKYEGIIYLKTESNKSRPAIARNLGIKKSTAEWVAFLDDDDVWVNTKLEEQMKYSDKYDFICSDAYYGIGSSESYNNKHVNFWDRVNPNNSNELTFDIIKKHNLIINSSVVLKKELIVDINYIDEEKPFEDYDTWLKILSKNKKCCYFVNKQLLYYNLDTIKFHI